LDFLSTGNFRKLIEIIGLKRINAVNGGKRNFGLDECRRQPEKGRSFGLPRPTGGFLFRSGKEDHPKAENHKKGSGAEIHKFGGYDLTYHGAQEATQSRGQYQSCGRPEENRPLGLAFGGEAEGGQLGLVPQFREENGTEGSQEYFEVHV
jgi:hypothetical protein